MLRTVRMISLLACLLPFSGIASAQPTPFYATMDGAQVIPPVATPATGTACFSVGLDGILNYDISFSGLIGVETAAHIHDQIGTVVFTLPPGSPKVGSVGPLNVIQLAQMAGGGWHVDIHTDTFPGGEISGAMLLIECPETTDSPEVQGVRSGGLLEQNRPNPFNPSTTIQYSLERATHVRLAIYNVQGAVVRTLIEDHRAAGDHSVQWDGRDEAGNPVVAGTYFYAIQAGDVRETRRMIHLR